jgi:hypothetical protein
VVATGGTGAGGATAVCQANATKCAGTSLQTCSGGQWGTAVSCGTRRSCTGPDGTAQCTCDVDALCTMVGGVCDGTARVVSCAQDANGCFYQASATPCTGGACSGAAGAAACCTNTCTPASATPTCVSRTSVQTCATVATGCYDTTIVNCDSGLVCERYGTASCVDPNWAEWPMPNFASDAAAGAPNAMNVTDSGDGTAVDNVTKLEWQRVVASSTYTWDQAVAYCSTLSLGGHSDWRLPSAIELVSTWDLDQSNAAVAAALLPLTSPVGLYWSASSAPTTSSPSRKAAVWFGSAVVDKAAPTSTYYVRCVR